MPLTQAQVARELKLSRSVVSDNVKAGMPLDSIEAVKNWRRRHVSQKYYYNSLAYQNMSGKGSNITADNNEGWETVEREYDWTVHAIDRMILEDWQKFKANKPAPCQTPRKHRPATLLGSWAIAGMIETGCDEEIAIARVQDLFRPVYYRDGFDRL